MRHFDHDSGILIFPFLFYQIFCYQWNSLVEFCKSQAWNVLSLVASVIPYSICWSVICYQGHCFWTMTWTYGSAMADWCYLGFCIPGWCTHVGHSKTGYNTHYMAQNHRCFFQSQNMQSNVTAWRSSKKRPHRVP